ncbi:MAG: hypothetical protein ACXACY_31300 [Candidatus Hodarchaeales archaeon]
MAFFNPYAISPTGTAGAPGICGGSGGSAGTLGGGEDGGADGGSFPEGSSCACSGEGAGVTTGSGWFALGAGLIQFMP